MDAGSDLGQRRQCVGVAVGVAVGRDPLVDLPDLHRRPIARPADGAACRERVGEIGAGRAARQREAGRAGASERTGQSTTDRACASRPRRPRDPRGSGHATRTSPAILPDRLALRTASVRFVDVPRFSDPPSGQPRAMTEGITQTGRAAATGSRDTLARVGLVAKGVLYLVLGLLAIQFARGEDDQRRGVPDRRHPDRGRPTVRQVLVGRPRGGLGGADAVARDPGRVRRPDRGRRDLRPFEVRRQGGALRRVDGDGRVHHRRQLERRRHEQELVGRRPTRRRPARCSTCPPGSGWWGPSGSP